MFFCLNKRKEIKAFKNNAHHVAVEFVLKKENRFKKVVFSETTKKRFKKMLIVNL